LLGRLWGMFAAVALVGIASFTGVAHAGEAAVVVDAQTGQVLQAVNADEQNYPASLTKMMTLYLTFQQLKVGGLTLDQQLPVSAWAANKAPTKLGLLRGQTITTQDCILGMVTKSANDAATVMAEKLGGSESRFVDMMNAQAALLGMSATHFSNASGLPDPHNTSTARDMMKLAMALYRDFPQYVPYFATTQFVFRGRVVRGHNHLMDRYPGMDGLKTGFTDASGFNIASTAVRDGHRLFGVVFGGRTAASRDQLMALLLDDGFEHRQTPEYLIAQAAGVGTAHRVLAALSPVGDAEADTLPAAERRKSQPRHDRHGKRVAAVATRKGRSDKRVAAVAAPKSCRRGAVCQPHRAVTRHAKRDTAVLAEHKQHRKSVAAASARE
jgi:D-alanyl-D-alanine carboxypeptidase